MMLVSTGFPPARGGIERTAGALAEHLDDFDLEVVAATPPLNAAGQGMRPPAGVEVHWVANRPAGGRRATLALNVAAVRLGMRTRPDVVLATHIRAMPAARSLARLRGSRSVVIIHAKEMREQRRLASAAVTWADAIVAASGFSRELALEAGADPNRIRVIHPGVDLDASEPVDVGDRPGPPTIVTVARMDDRHKGHREALEVMRSVRERVRDARWIMVGEGRLRGELTATAASLGLAGCVTFPGPVTDESLRRTLSGAHVFCLLSRPAPTGWAGEGFGIVLVEAGASGLPVLAGRVPGVVDAVKHGRTGLLVEPDDLGAAADALVTLLTDRRLATTMGRAGRAWATELAWPAVVGRYRTLIDEVTALAPLGEGSQSARWAVDLVRGPQL